MLHRNHNSFLLFVSNVQEKTLAQNSSCNIMFDIYSI